MRNPMRAIQSPCASRTRRTGRAPTATPDMRGIALRVQCIGNRATRPPRHQLSGFARAQCATIRQLRRGDRRRHVSRVLGIRGTVVQRRSGRDYPHAQQRQGGAPQDRQRRARDLLEPRRDTLGTNACGAFSDPPAQCGAGRRSDFTGPGLSVAGIRVATRQWADPGSSSRSNVMSTTAARRSRTHRSHGSPRRRTGRAVATLTIPQQHVATAAWPGRHPRTIDALAFNPWNTTDEFRPLGNLNRARKDVYDASAAHRLADALARRAAAAQPHFGGMAQQRSSRSINRRYRMAPAAARLSLLNLDMHPRSAAARKPDRYRAAEAPPKARPVPPPPPEETSRDAHASTARATTSRRPKMGAVGSTFGRNLKPDFRARAVRRAQPDRGRARAARPRDLPPGALAQPPGRRLDPVPGARLGQPRAAIRSASRTRHRGPAARSARTGNSQAAARSSAKCASPATIAAMAHGTPTCSAMPRRIGGTAPRFMAPTSKKAACTARRRQDPASTTATCRSTRTAWRSPASTRAGGWA